MLSANNKPPQRLKNFTLRMNKLRIIGWLLVLSACRSPQQQPAGPSSDTAEQHRPLIHFTPKTAWMNDPNGMVYGNGTYHLFYQHYPDSTVWGPMHWGHATSKNLVQWQHQPIALYPDSLGYIFSGSCVMDSANTSGFGSDGKPAMVAVFTHHDPKGEKAGTDTFQYQSIAYSVDEGTTWTKYAGNPVLRNPGIRDFRDPKVMRHAATNRWVMTLATKDRVTFYSSPNLKEWKKESEFGAAVGAHGGVWECPDLFPLQHEGKMVWVLLVSINPGGPNGGSATQYFVGDFNGKTFVPFDTATRWIDYGPDNYAGVTWSNTGNTKIFMGWMSNWMYATKVPTRTWRSAMTVPRTLSLQKTDEGYRLRSCPAEYLKTLEYEEERTTNVDARNLLLTQTKKVAGAARLNLSAAKLQSFSVVLSNAKGQKVVVGYDQASNNYFIDRTASGTVDFEKGFAARHTAPRLSKVPTMDLTLVIDVASVELFTDGGLSVMTSVFFPDEPFTDVSIQSAGAAFDAVRWRRLKSIHP